MVTLELIPKPLVIFGTAQEIPLAAEKCHRQTNARQIIGKRKGMPIAFNVFLRPIVILLKTLALYQLSEVKNLFKRGACWVVTHVVFAAGQTHHGGVFIRNLAEDGRTHLEELYQTTFESV